MDTEIQYLKELERDLERVAAFEAADGGRRKRSRSRSRQWIPAVAAVLVVAWGIGTVVQNPEALPTFASGSDDSGAAGASASAVPGTPDEAEAPADAPMPGVGDEQAWKRVQSGAEFDYLGQDSSTGGITASGDGNRSGSTTPPSDLSKIVRTGRLRVKVDDGTFRDARDAAVTIAEDAGGFILDSRVEGRSGTFTLRVPARRFDAVMTKLGRLGDVDLEEQNGEDVTAEFIDLSARVRILMARREVIENLMDEATGLSESLLLTNRFFEVQLQLEQLTGELRFLNDQVEESTITLEIVERSAPQQREEQVDNPSLLEAWKRGIQGFLNVLAVAIIGLGYLLPLLVVVGVWFGVRELTRRRRRG